MQVIVPDAVMDAGVSALLLLLRLCGGPEALAVTLIVLVAACVFWTTFRCFGVNKVTVLLVSVLCGIGYRQMQLEAALPNVSLEEYGVFDTPASFSDLKASEAEKWGHISTSADGWFKDDGGRVLMLRGINLAGTSKLPRIPDGSTFKGRGAGWRRDHRNVSFVGRPFPLEEADEHLARLRAWGLTFVRFLVTWEAIEHEGPGIYDQDYIDYVVAVVRKMDEYGISCFIDPHQDVWSRFTGGDGAPGWTLEVRVTFEMS